MYRIVIILGGLCLLSSLVTAAPVLITSGTADFTIVEDDIYHPGQFAVNGPGFSLIGSGAGSVFPCAPFPLPCAAGTSISGTAGLSSGGPGAISGTLTVGGESFPYHASEAPGAPGLDLDLRYNFVIPNVGPDPPGSLTVTAPFTTGFSIFTAGEFSDPFAWPGPPIELIMSGQGTVTANLQLETTDVPGPGTFYRFQSLHFDFFAVPEPGTTVLVIPVLAGLCAFGLRQRSAQRRFH